MTSSDMFVYLWLGIVAVAAIASPIQAIRDLRRGSAQYMQGDDYRAERDVDPSVFWLNVWSKILVCPVAIFVFWEGLQMLEWS